MENRSLLLNGSVQFRDVKPFLLGVMLEYAGAFAELRLLFRGLFHQLLLHFRGHGAIAISKLDMLALLGK